MAETMYWPEMGEAKPAARIEATLASDAKHYIVKTPMVLSGRGIEHLGTYTDANTNEYGKHLIGWHRYKVTKRAYAAVEAKHDVSREVLLD